MSQSNASERRVFLRVLGAAAATLAASACGGESTAGSGGAGGGGGAGGMGGAGGAGGVGGAPCPVGIEVGDPSLFTTDGLHTVPGSSVLIGRDAGGLYALSSICTHRGCNMNIDGAVLSTGIECTCHHSVFSNSGSVTQGPAGVPLVAYALAVGCGQVWVDTNQIVAPSVRVVA